MKKPFLFLCCIHFLLPAQERPLVLPAHIPHDEQLMLVREGKDMFTVYDFKRNRKKKIQSYDLDKQLRTISKKQIMKFAQHAALYVKKVGDDYKVEAHVRGSGGLQTLSTIFSTTTRVVMWGIPLYALKWAAFNGPSSVPTPAPTSGPSVDLSMFMPYDDKTREVMILVADRLTGGCIKRMAFPGAPPGTEDAIFKLLDNAAKKSPEHMKRVGEATAIVFTMGTDAVAWYSRVVDGCAAVAGAIGMAIPWL